jgi:aminoglycoside phosphotransferase
MGERVVVMPPCSPAVVELIGGSRWTPIPAYDRNGRPPIPRDGGRSSDDQVDPDGPVEQGADRPVGGDPGRGPAEASEASIDGSVGRWTEAVRWRAGRYRVTLAPSAEAAETEADRIRWLSDRLRFDGQPAAGRVVTLDDRWLVVEGPDGDPADRPERHPEPDEVPQLVGRALRALHQLDPADCPYARPLADEVADLGAAAASDRLDPARLPPPYDRYPPADLVRMIDGPPATRAASAAPSSPSSPSVSSSPSTPASRAASAAPSSPSSPSVSSSPATRVASVAPSVSSPAQPADSGPQPTDLVVGHGRPLAGHVLVGPTGPAGLIALDRLAVVDRHRDLAVVHRHLQTLFGGEAVFAFYQGYGLDPDLIRLDRAILLDVLDGAVITGARSKGRPAPETISETAP